MIRHHLSLLHSVFDGWDVMDPTIEAADGSFFSSLIEGVEFPDAQTVFYFSRVDDM